MYRENPKMVGSGILGCIPQSGRCLNECAGCFFQSGKGYLEPLASGVPNVPSLVQARGRVVHVNDGNDSNQERDKVIAVASRYQMYFYNTAGRVDLEGFGAPVVLTVNPAEMTDADFLRLEGEVPKNLMFVRVRTNVWNVRKVVDRAVDYYTGRRVPVVLTFMAYMCEDELAGWRSSYTCRKRTTNMYYAITTEAWEMIMKRYRYNKYVRSCGKIEGEKGDTHCRFCGNCLREYFATVERMRA